ncbi:TPA: hypothetical protein ACMEO8_005298 [Klebsiella quasipneumoniae subsp. similipneumoniae]|nr:hypothetical protein [Klebsiella pneumoniae]
MPYETYVNENTMKAYCVVTITNDREYEEAIRILNSISLEKERLCKTVHEDFSQILNYFAAQIEVLMIAYEKDNSCVSRNIERKKERYKLGVVFVSSFLLGIAFMVHYFVSPQELGFLELISSLALLVTSASAFQDYRALLSRSKR